MSAYQEERKATYRQKIRARLIKQVPATGSLDWFKVGSLIFNALLVLTCLFYFADLRSQHHKDKALAKAASLDGQVKPLILQLENELNTLHASRSEPGAMPPMFRPKAFDLEISFVAEHTEGETNKVEYRILTAQDEQKASTQVVQKLTIHMDLIKPEKGHSGPAE